MSTDEDVQWWGIVSFHGCEHYSDEHRMSVRNRTERLLDDCAQVDGFEASGEPGAVRLVWSAPNDLNKALQKLHTVTNFGPADFDPQNRPEVVPA